MKNPKTTITGYLAVAIGVLTIAHHMLLGQSPSITDVQNLAGAISTITGLGNIFSSDGGH